MTVYPSWQVLTFTGPNPTAAVESVPGGVGAVFQIPLVFPATAQNGATSLGNEVYRGFLGPPLQLAVFDYIPPVSNWVGVYVKF